MDNWRSEPIAAQPAAQPAHRAANLSLRVGLVLAGLVILLAIFGPILAPRDPLKENFIIFVSDNAFVKPPSGVCGARVPAWLR